MGEQLGEYVSEYVIDHGKQIFPFFHYSSIPPFQPHALCLGPCGCEAK